MEGERTRGCGTSSSCLFQCAGSLALCLEGIGPGRMEFCTNIRSECCSYFDGIDAGLTLGGSLHQESPSLPDKIEG